MSKKLSEMTLEELWQLFPIILVEHQHEWKEWYKNDKRISFNKGYTENGFAEKVYHLHLRYVGDNDELYFRDYLLEHPEAAKEYEALKLGVWKEYEHNRDGYTNAKRELVAKYTENAKAEYADRYC